MHLAFFQQKYKYAEEDLINCVRRFHGVRVTILKDVSERCDCDAYCFIGIKHMRHFKNLINEGVSYLLWDKGYNRDWSEWWRVSPNAYQPWRHLMTGDYPPDRAEAQGWLGFPPWRRRPNGAILYAGGSSKYHTIFNLPAPDEYLAGLIREIRGVTDRAVIDRFRRSPDPVSPVAGSLRASWPDLAAQLNEASVLLTHGSSACLEALQFGIPCIILGDAVLRPISSTSISDIEAPRKASWAEKRHLLSALAYFQYSRAEIKDGLPWRRLNSIMQKRTCAAISAE